jgi:hypothetical protein
VDIEMIPQLLASGIILYGIIQLVVAFIAVVLAVKWNKYEFLAGLSFLLLYALVELTDMFFFTIVESVFIDVAQFGFILLAIIFFIIGMHPSWSQSLALCRRGQSPGDISSQKESIISILKKI